MRKIHLHGKLRREFGATFNFEVETAGEAIRALHVNFPKFIEVLREGSYILMRGDKRKGMSLDLPDVNSFKLGNGDLHIIPALKGSASGGGGSKGGTTKVILGVALIGAAVFFSGGTLAGATAGLFGGAIGGFSAGTLGLIGLSLTLAGAAQLLTTSEKSQDEVKKDDSFSFSGPINTNEQGNAVPLIYGRVITGSQQISASLDVEDIPVGA